MSYPDRAILTHGPGGHLPGGPWTLGGPCQSQFFFFFFLLHKKKKKVAAVALTKAYISLM